MAAARRGDGDSEGRATIVAGFEIRSDCEETQGLRKGVEPTVRLLVLFGGC